jgi:hypothetical protein
MGENRLKMDGPDDNNSGEKTLFLGQEGHRAGVIRAVAGFFGRGKKGKSHAKPLDSGSKTGKTSVKTTDSGREPGLFDEKGPPAPFGPPSPPSRPSGHQHCMP